MNKQQIYFWDRLSYVNAIVLLFYCLFFVLLTSCYGIYTPAPLLNHAGAPARFEKAEMEVGVSVLGTTHNAGAHIGVDYAPADCMRLEIGGDWIYDIQATGFVGARFVPYPLSRQREVSKLLLDFELGGALGVGGFNDEFFPEGEVAKGIENEKIDAYRNFAGGGYVGFGLGLNNKYIDFYTKIRGQISTAERLPTTYWVGLVGGLQVTIQKVRIYADHGPIFYFNDKGWSIIHAAELGFRFFFNLLKEIENFDCEENLECVLYVHRLEKIGRVLQLKNPPHGFPDLPLNGL